MIKNLWENISGEMATRINQHVDLTNHIQTIKKDVDFQKLKQDNISLGKQCVMDNCGKVSSDLSLKSDQSLGEYKTSL